MRVLVCCDEVGALDSRAAGAIVGTAWPGPDTVVVPVGEAGRGFAVAATPPDGGAVVAVGGAGVGTGPIPYAASSTRLGRQLAQALVGRPTTVLVDLVSDDVHDGGAGLLAALGARADGPLDAGVAGLSELTAVDLEPARVGLAGIELIGVVPDGQRSQRLLGLRGITSVRGRAVGEDPATLLATDATLSRWTDLVAPGRGDEVGTGAEGGIGLAVLALGGRLTTGPEWSLSGVRGPFDLVVTGCTRFDFASRGGGVVAEAARLAERLLCPCVVIAGEVLIGAREMRTMGVEAAYPITTAGPIGPGPIAPEALGATARRVARNWSW